VINLTKNLIFSIRSLNCAQIFYKILQVQYINFLLVITSRSLKDLQIRPKRYC
jgi:hypothetical protein